MVPGQNPTFPRELAARHLAQGGTDGSALKSSYGRNLGFVQMVVPEHRNDLKVKKCWFLKNGPSEGGGLEGQMLSLYKNDELDANHALIIQKYCFGKACMHFYVVCLIYHLIAILRRSAVWGLLEHILGKTGYADFDAILGRSALWDRFELILGKIDWVSSSCRFFA